MSIRDTVQSLRNKVETMKREQEAKPKFNLGVPLAIGAIFTVCSLAAPVAAGDINESISPILEDVTALFTPLLNLIIGAVPLIIVLGVATFVLGLLSGILQKIKV